MLRPTFPTETPAWRVEVERMLTAIKRSNEATSLILEELSAGTPFGGVVPKKIGFDLAAFDVGVMDHVEKEEDLATGNIDRIDNCLLVLAGLHNDDCGNAMNFGSERWTRVAEWIEAGGRFWLNTEYALDDPSECLADRANCNAFLSAIGSGITVGTGYHDCDEPDWLNATAGAANISQGLSFKMACTTAISGGTAVWLSPDSTVMVAAEQLGDGFVFVSGDGNIWDTDIVDINSQMIRRLMQYQNSEVI